jgi:ATP-dependent helicase/DNAse subunit B
MTAKDYVTGKKSVSHLKNQIIHVFETLDQTQLEIEAHHFTPYQKRVLKQLKSLCDEIIYLLETSSLYD